MGSKNAQKQLARTSLRAITVVASVMNPENYFLALSSYVLSHFNSQGNVGQEKAPKKHTAKTALLNIASLRNLLNVIQRA